MYAILIIGTKIGFYIADDEEQTTDLTKSATYESYDEACYDAKHIMDTWWQVSRVQVVKVA